MGSKTHIMKYLTSLIAIVIATNASAQVLQSDANPPPSLHAIIMGADEQPDPGRVLLVFRSEKQAKTWTTIAGFSGIVAGGYLLGKAEMKSRYHGTTSNWDSYHITRDAGLIVTGLGAGALGASVTIGQRTCPLEILWKIGAGCILHRITAEATYRATRPAR